MESKHVGFFPSFFATMAFMVPMFYFYLNHLDILMLLWNGVVIYLLINGFSNKRWASELDKRSWFILYKGFYQKIFKSHN